MKAIRTIVNSNKGLFSFWMLLFFVTASNARNVVSVFQDIHKAEQSYQPKQGKYLVSEAIDESDISTLSLKDSDVDDIEFTYYGNYNTQKPVVLPGKEHNYVQETEHFSAYKIPLYDLYCNWKFHLS